MTYVSENQTHELHAIILLSVYAGGAKWKYFSTSIMYSLSMPLFRSSRPEVFCRKGVLRNFAKFTGKHLCQNLVFNKVAGVKKESLAQVFSCEFFKISKNTFFHRTPLVAASIYWHGHVFNIFIKTI